MHFAGRRSRALLLVLAIKPAKLRSLTAALLMVWCPSARPPAAAPLRLKEAPVDVRDALLHLTDLINEYLTRNAHIYTLSL